MSPGRSSPFGSRAGEPLLMTNPTWSARARNTYFFGSDADLRRKVTLVFAVVPAGAKSDRRETDHPLHAERQVKSCFFEKKLSHRSAVTDAIWKNDSCDATRREKLDTSSHECERGVDPRGSCQLWNVQGSPLDSLGRVVLLVTKRGIGQNQRELTTPSRYLPICDRVAHDQHLGRANPCCHEIHTGHRHRRRRLVRSEQPATILKPILVEPTPPSLVN